MNTEAAINVSCVSKVFGGFKAVDKVSLTVNKGEIYGFIGKNGAGKTTLMRMIAGLMKPTAGKINILGIEQQFGLENCTLPKIGFLPQNVRFDDNSSVKEIIKFFTGLKRVEVKECLAFAEELGLDLGKKAKNMSPGQQRKLQIVIVTAGKPEILMLDEPTAGLDPSAAQQLKEVIRKLNSSGCSVFISSHILRELDDFCTQVAVIDKGKILFEGCCENSYEIEAEGVDESILSFISRETGISLKQLD